MGREVKLKDLAVVCANCHVMIHMGGKCRPLAGLIPTSADDQVDGGPCSVAVGRALWMPRGSLRMARVS
jgi:hypothetical protein